MDNQYSKDEVAAFGDDLLGMRVYTSRLLGREPSLVLHGGGNTSVKIREADFFGDPHDVLYVKGSGWDLKSIEREGFSPVRMDTLLRLASLETLSDPDMVRLQKSAMTDGRRPNPSVETILHAALPAVFVDHTHADAVVAITNTPRGIEFIEQIYGDSVIILPYVMPGFDLARAVVEALKDADYDRVKGLILLNHGVFTFGDTGAESYGRMIQIVSLAEDFLRTNGALVEAVVAAPRVDLARLAQVRLEVSRSLGAPVLAIVDASPEAAGFADLPGFDELASRGTLTPDHVIRTKPKPLLISTDPAADVRDYGRAYRSYFQRNGSANLTCLDHAPRWALWPSVGAVAFGRTLAEACIVDDITRHTRRAIQWSEGLGGWQPLGEADLFNMEYWELEQAKLAQGKRRGAFAGRVALVTGGASGIGRAVCERLLREGAAVVSLDRDPSVTTAFESLAYRGIVADVTSSSEVRRAVESVISSLGGLDMVVSNAGSFPPSVPLEDCTDAAWEETLALNLNAHQKVLRESIRFLKKGWEPSVIFVGSKNVPAPGPGVAAYSVAKAGLAQLARVAALELGAHQIRVNTVHPNAVFDTGIWSDETIATRAASYGVSSAEYRKKNVLGVEIGSQDVARLVVAMLGPVFSKTTGAQIPIDGGNERVI